MKSNEFSSVSGCPSGTELASYFENVKNHKAEISEMIPVDNNIKNRFVLNSDVYLYRVLNKECK